MPGPRGPGAELEFELKSARNGAPSLSLGGRQIHGLYDPQRDARRAAARIAERVGGAAVVLLGAGLGLLPTCLRARGVRDLVVFEPFPRLRAALPEALRGAEPDVHSATELAATLAARPHQLILHPGYEDLVRFEQRFALRALRRRARAADGLVASERSFASLARLPGLRTLEALDGCLAGRSVVIASGGPSLDLALPALRGTDAIVLAAPQALERLLRAEVRVDLVLSPDPGDWLTPVLGRHGAPFGALIADTSTHPDVLDRCPQRCFLIHLRSRHLHQRAWEQAGLPVIDEPFVTVSETAFHVAHGLGARRVLLAGVDLDATNPHYGSPLRAPNPRGEMLETNPVYFQAARYLSHVLPSLEGTDVVRVGEGLAIDGARPLAPQDIPEWLRAGTPADRTALELPTADPGAERLARSVEACLAGAPPPIVQARLAPANADWAGFEPLAADEVAARWTALRSTLGAAGS